MRTVMQNGNADASEGGVQVVLVVGSAKVATMVPMLVLVVAAMVVMAMAMAWG